VRARPGNRRDGGAATGDHQPPRSRLDVVKRHARCVFVRRSVIAVASESAEMLKEALDLIRSIPDPNRNLRAFHDVCSGMQLARFMDEEYLDTF
jgi:hypothetical protein